MIAFSFELYFFVVGIRVVCISNRTRIMVHTYLPSRLMFCDIAPFSFNMESIILTGSSRLRKEGLLSCRALVGSLLSEVLLLWLSSAAEPPASV